MVKASTKQKTKHKYSYVLRTCNADLTSWGGFQWPSSGIVKALDWDPKPTYGYGLHGFLNGEGDSSLANWNDDAKWLVVKVRSDLVLDLEGKVKFPRCRVVCVGTRKDATDYIQKKVDIAQYAIMGASTQAGNRGTATAGNRGTATAGYGGTATAGDRGTATAGNRGTATAGYGGTATAGSYGTATAGEGGTATAGDRGTAKAGSYGTATAGEGGTATAGNRGTATAGYGGTATAGDRGTAKAGEGGTAKAGEGGTATAGDRGTAKAGEGGELHIRWYDAKRYRTAVFYVGEDSIEANVAYRCESGKAVRA